MTDLGGGADAPLGDRNLLLPGWTAYRWLNMVFIGYGIVFVGTFIMLAFAIPVFLHLISSSFLLVSLWGLAILVFGLLFGVGVPSIWSLYRELRAGYTTLLAGYRQFEQRDPETGVGLREPGGEFPPRLGLSAARAFARDNQSPEE